MGSHSIDEYVYLSRSWTKDLSKYKRLEDTLVTNSYTNEQRVIVRRATYGAPYCIYSLTNKDFIFTSERVNLCGDTVPDYVLVYFDVITQAIDYLMVWSVTP